MKLSFRYRIILTLLPLLALLAILGGTGCLLLVRLGNRADVILRENYDSVLYMERTAEALERIDSSFMFLLVGRDKVAQEQYEENRQVLRVNLDKELNNITVPGERELAERLERLTEQYLKQGDAYFALARTERERAYFGAEGKQGLYGTFKDLKAVTEDIRRLNQENMEEASRQARATAGSSLAWFAVGLAVTAVLAAVLAVRTVREILGPMQTLTESALSIGAGQLDQIVPVVTSDEIGKLAGAFNTMARQLRAYRESQQAQMLRLQSTTQAAIDSFPHPVLVVDPEGFVELINPAARRALGIVAGEGGLKSSVPWQAPESLQEPLQQALRAQTPYQPDGLDRVLAIRMGKEEKFFLPRILPIRDTEGTTLGAAVLLEDVTRFRLLDEVKSNLVATVSHELKTPLTSLRLAIHLLLEEKVGLLNPKQLELLLDARENTERLLATINSLLDLARLQQGQKQLDLEPQDMAELVRDVADIVRPRAQDKGLELSVNLAPVLPAVQADARQLGHALENLLDNAVRHTQRGGRILLDADSANGKVILTVADTGEGIPPEYLPHVFDRFFRVPGQSQDHGTGLGLAIVREIVTAHGGTVAVESDVGKGTTFRISLPVLFGSALPSVQAGGAVGS